MFTLDIGFAFVVVNLFCVIYSANYSVNYYVNYSVNYSVNLLCVRYWQILGCGCVYFAY